MRERPDLRPRRPLPENLLDDFDFAVSRLPIDVFFSFRCTPGWCATSCSFRSACRRAHACSASWPICRNSSVTRRSASAAFSTSPAAFSTTANSEVINGK